MSDTYKVKNLNMPFSFLNVYNEFLVLLEKKKSFNMVYKALYDLTLAYCTSFHTTMTLHLGMIHSNLIFQFLKQTMLLFHPWIFLHAVSSTCEAAHFYIILFHSQASFRAWLNCQFLKQAFSDGHHLTSSN